MDEVELSIQDDGRGFVVLSRLGLLAKEGHFGLLGMKEQIELVGGGLQVMSQPGAGTEIKAQVPLSHTREKSVDSSYFSSSVGAAA